ncbi:PEP-CTERM sorting domain-containing protein [Novipirellula caenicola]|uniref:PEP-CTERM protein-sorting domain-containing protein n=1 Tax=Novipirellula caenicola TaxID=1536901 RepID=A0ABP9W221_9BACT
MLSIYKSVLLLLALVTLNVHQLDAAFVVKIGTGDPQVIPAVQAGGAPIVIPVSIYSTEASGPRTLTGYNLGFDFDTTGVGYSGVFTDFGVVFNPTFAANSGALLPDPDAENFDFQFVTSGNTGVDIFPYNSPTNTFHLFDLTFKASALAAPGFYDFVFEPNASHPGAFGGSDNINVVNGTSVDAVSLIAEGGQFEVQNASGVPEPSSMLALAGVFAVGGVRQWRKKRRGAAEPAAC